MHHPWTRPATRRPRRGITIFEVAGTMVLVGIIMAVALPIAQRTEQTGQDEIARLSLQTAETLVHQAILDNGRLVPTSESDLVDQIGPQDALTVTAGPAVSSGPTDVVVLVVDSDFAPAGDGCPDPETGTVAGCVIATARSGPEGCLAWVLILEESPSDPSLVLSTPATWGQDTDADLFAGDPSDDTDNMSRCDPSLVNVNDTTNTAAGTRRVPSELDLKP